MASRTYDASSSDTCGCKKGGLVAQKAGGNTAMQPILVEYVGDTPENQIYQGKATRYLYRSIYNGAVLQVYLGDYRADVESFNVV